MGLTLDEMLHEARGIWAGSPELDLPEVVVHLMVVVGDLARQERARFEGGSDGVSGEVATELGNVLLSVVRWCDDLGYDPSDCVRRAAIAQLRYSERLR